MPKHYILVYRYGGGDHQIRFGIKTDPNRSVPYEDKPSIDGVVSAVNAIADVNVLRRKPYYEHLSTSEVSAIESARNARISELEK